MKSKQLLLGVGFGVALAAGLFLALRALPTPTPALKFAQALPSPNPMPEFALQNEQGQPIDQTVFEGQWDLVFFGFTHCPDICPTTLHVLASAKTALQEDGHTELPRIVLVSVDPERDTPEQLARYVNNFGAGNLGITGTLDETTKLTSGIGIFFQKQPTDNDSYTVDHSSAVLLVNPNGEFSALFGGPHQIGNYIHDLPILMDGD